MTDTDAAKNKEIVLTWFRGLVSGDAPTALGLMHDDFRYWMAGNMPASGWHDRDGFFETTQVLGELAEGPMTMKLGDVVAEGDRVLIEAESSMPLKGGGTYNNFYVMAIRVRDGKVVEFKEFSDSLHTYQAMDHPQTRGPAKDRQSPLTDVKEIWDGQAQEMNA